MVFGDIWRRGDDLIFLRLDDTARYFTFPFAQDWGDVLAENGTDRCPGMSVTDLDADITETVERAAILITNGLTELRLLCDLKIGCNIV